MHQLFDIHTPGINVFLYSLHNALVNAEFHTFQVNKIMYSNPIPWCSRFTRGNVS